MSSQRLHMRRHHLLFFFCVRVPPPTFQGAPVPDTLRAMVPALRRVGCVDNFRSVDFERESATASEQLYLAAKRLANSQILVSVVACRPRSLASSAAAPGVAQAVSARSNRADTESQAVSALAQLGHRS